MFLNLADDEQIVLSLKEFSILVALAAGRASGYEISRLCAEDAGIQRASRGGLYPAL